MRRRVAWQVGLVLVATGLGGLCGWVLTFLLLSLGVLPQRGWAMSLVYLATCVAAGGVVGLVFGLRNRPPGEAWITRRYLVGVGGALVFNVVYLLAYLNIEALQRHH